MVCFQQMKPEAPTKTVELTDDEKAVELLRLAWQKKPLYNHMLFLHLQEAEKAASA